MDTQIDVTILSQEFPLSNNYNSLPLGNLKFIIARFVRRLDDIKRHRVKPF